MSSPIAFIGMETSGALRSRFNAFGIECWSADLLPSEDGGENHIVGDVFEALEWLRGRGKWPSLGVFHPPCTYLTNAAEWAFADPDFTRYPGVGYHQRLELGTLFGAARRQAREDASALFMRIVALDIEHKAIENPKGAMSSAYRSPDQTIQPHQFGDDASKGTCLWLFNLPRLPIDPSRRAAGRLVRVPRDGAPLVSDARPWEPGYGKLVERWSNQTDGGQNKLTPGVLRWKERSRTYPGIADAAVETWGNAILKKSEKDLFSIL